MRTNNKILSNKKDNDNNNQNKESNLGVSLDNLCKTMKIIIESQNKQIEKQEKKLERQDKIIKTQGEELKSLKQLNKQQSNKINVLEENIEKQKEKYKIIIRNVKFDLEDLNKKSLKLDSELTLIKARDSIKNIIDLLSKAFDLQLDISFDEKYLAIIKKINK